MLNLLDWIHINWIQKHNIFQ